MTCYNSVCAISEVSMANIKIPGIGVSRHVELLLQSMFSVMIEKFLVLKMLCVRKTAAG